MGHAHKLKNCQALLYFIGFCWRLPYQNMIVEYHISTLSKQIPLNIWRIYR